MQDIKIVLTMDCEPTTATSHPSATGPATWGVGEDAVRGYVEIAAGYGLPVTLFVHPEAAMAQAEMFRELERNGACLGLHMHPWKYSLWKHGGRKFMAHYGGLSPGDQEALLAEASDIWAEAIGHRPTYFRPGTFSANDAIFQVLHARGFRGGSCTAPGRIIPEMQAIWTAGQPIRIARARSSGKRSVLSTSRTCRFRRISPGCSRVQPDAACMLTFDPTSIGRANTT
jgi:Polysaccharide deacetylase